MSPNRFTQGHLMKIELLVAGITVVGSPNIAERAMYFGGDFTWALFWPIQAVFLVREPFCDVGTPS